MKNCKNCVYWVSPKEVEANFCTRYPPTIFGVIGSDGHTICSFPRVYPDTLCGEFVKLGEPSTRDTLENIASDLDGIARWS